MDINKEYQGRRFSFGMYKFNLIKDVIKDDPFYIKWCLQNVDGFYLTGEEEVLYKQSLSYYKERTPFVKFKLDLPY